MPSILKSRLAADPSCPADPRPPDRPVEATLGAPSADLLDGRGARRHYVTSGGPRSPLAEEGRALLQHEDLEMLMGGTGEEARRGLADRHAAVATEPGHVRTITAVIVHVGDWRLLERCLEALRKSRGVSLEVVVVANGCKEAPPEHMRGQERLHLVISEPSLGFSEANNLGVRWVETHLGLPDSYLFLNNDTEVEPTALSTLADRLHADPRMGIVGPCLKILGAENHLNSLGLNVTTIGESWDEGIGRRVDQYGALPETREVLAVTGSALMIRPSTLAAVGGWTEFYGFYFEDVDLCLKARSHGWSVANETEAVVFHELSATAGQVSDFKRLLSWRNQMLLLMVHWPTGLLLKILPRLLAREIAIYLKRRRVGAHGDARLQARAWRGVLELLPDALRERRRRGPRADWTRWLVAPGSVPEIRLPEQRRPEVRDGLVSRPGGSATGVPPGEPRSPAAGARAIE